MASKRSKNFQMIELGEGEAKITLVKEGESVCKEEISKIIHSMDSVACVTYKGKDAFLLGRRGHGAEVNPQVNCLFSLEFEGPALLVQKTNSK